MSTSKVDGIHVSRQGKADTHKDFRVKDTFCVEGDIHGLKDRNPAFEYDDVVIDGAHIESLSDNAELPNLILQLHQNQLTINSGKQC